MFTHWMQHRYFLLYVVAGFLGFALLWFNLRAPAGDAPARWTPHPETTPATASATASAATETFTPDETNVDPSLHTQIESLRIRLVETPDDTTHLIRFARLMQDAHRPEEAARTYAHYLALHPANRQAWLDLTQAYGALQQWDNALTAADRMLARYPDDPSGLYNRGAIFANTSRFTEARAIWEQVAAQTRDAEVAAMARTSLPRLPTTP